MTIPQSLSTATPIEEILAAEFTIPVAVVTATIALLDEGSTVPFIARYRKEVTGGLDDTQLRQFDARLSYLRDLRERQATILSSIESQGKLTEDLRRQILAVETKARLEDLYLPFKTTRRTKATMAREAGLEPLVERLLAGDVSDPVAVAEEFITAGFDDAKAVLAGAQAIVVDRIATDADLVGKVRQQFEDTGAAAAHVVAGQEDKGQKYRDYFDFREPFRSLPSHRILALLRGEAENILELDFTAGADDLEYQNLIATDMGLSGRGDAADAFRAECVRTGWTKKLAVSSATDARAKLKEKADADAVAVFSRNLKDLLLAAPAGQRATLGLDPGYRNGVKTAVVDATGKVVATCIVYPHNGASRWAEAVEVLSAAVRAHGVELIAVGNGTASRETEKLAKEIAANVAAGSAGGADAAGGAADRAKPTVVMVSEAGASVYSASELAAKEFPDMDVTLRGAVSIARRLQDPLAELVKIDPKSIGVGQYQHDVNQKLLTRELDAVVEDVVNSVGVDVNSASAALLQRVAGITPVVADNIVAYRDENGSFSSRRQLLKVPRLGPKAYEQCAGFLRIRGGADPLDASAVHPEAYSIVRRMTESLGMDVSALIGNSAVLGTLDPRDFTDEQFGVPTVTDVIRELDKPGRDPRPTFATVQFTEGVEKITDLVPGMILEGTVTNVAAFGAFVDIGVHQDGLVHVSAMSDRFVRDPHDIVSSGQIVRVKVVEVDVDRNRIGLSLRLSDDAGRGAGTDRNHGRPRAQKQRAQKEHAQKQRGSRRGAASQPAATGALADALKRAGFSS